MGRLTDLSEHAGEKETKIVTLLMQQYKTGKLYRDMGAQKEFCRNYVHAPAKKIPSVKHFDSSEFSSYKLMVVNLLGFFEHADGLACCSSFNEYLWPVKCTSAHGYLHIIATQTGEVLSQWSGGKHLSNLGANFPSSAKIQKLPSDSDSDSLHRNFQGRRRRMGLTCNGD
jgi:hypothetical protein